MLPRTTIHFALLAALLLAVACGDDDDDDTATADAATSLDAAADAAPPACPRTPAPADRARYVVVAHPYDAGGAKADTYEVWELSAAGDLSRTASTFSMGRNTGAVIGMTPDGEVGITPQEDGTLGVFRLDDQGAPTVVHDHLAGDYYAASVVMAADGQHVYVLDTQWRENGGGIYRLRIGCDGALSEETRLVPAKLPAALIFPPGAPDRALLAADDVLDSPANLDAHLLDWSAAPSWLDGVDGFPDDEAIIGSAAVTSDGGYFLIGDNSGFSGVPNRVAVIEVQPGGLVPRQVLSPIEDPYAIVTSPFGNAAFVVSGFGDALIELDYDAGNASAPFSIGSELTYAGNPPALPGKAVLIERGSLRGRVLISENVGVRQVEFQADGSIVDLGLTTFGDGFVNIVGGIGVQP